MFLFYPLYQQIAGAAVEVSLVSVGFFVSHLRLGSPSVSAVVVLKVQVARCSVSLPVGDDPVSVVSPHLTLFLCCGVGVAGIKGWLARCPAALQVLLTFFS